MLMVVVSMVVVMMVVVVMRKYHAILIHVAELLALILARERAKEGYDSGNLIIINMWIIAIPIMMLFFSYSMC